MTRRSLAAVVSLCTLALVSCCQDGGPDPTPTVLLYMAGYYASAVNDVAVSWKQDLASGGPLEMTTLLDAGVADANARAASVFVSGSDVYVAGYYSTPLLQYIACYWKNGVKTDLYTGTGNAKAASVFVSGSDVYVAGYIDEGTMSAGYWKNGAWQLLYGTKAAEATDIVVSNSVVYVSGYVTATGKTHACYWKNGSQIDLYTANNSAGYAIAVSGLDVYVAGYYTNASSKNVACYWKNASAGVVDLYNDAANQGQALAICVDGADVYAAGYVNEGTQNACYWKNGSRATIDARTSWASSVIVVR